MFFWVDHAYNPANLGGHPKLGPVLLKHRVTRPGPDNHIGHHLAGLRIDEMSHIARFGGANHDLAVRAYGHALRFHANLDLAFLPARVDVDNGDGIVILVRDIEELASGIQGEEFGVGPGWEVASHLLRLGIDDLDGVVVASRDDYILAVLRHHDAARALANFDGLRNL